MTTASRRLTNFLGVERNVTAASGAVFLVGLGEELWKKFLPKYLELLGASATVIGLFGTAEDFFDAIPKIADRLGRKPFVIATFVCFALFPVAVVLANSFAWLVGAFVIGGLREIGEPSRKAMIVDFADAQTRARTVGLYYLVRSLSITPASAIGGLLWRIKPQIPFFAAGVIGIVGTLLFAATVEERKAV